MSLWEYKVISSGKGGFATPALLEKFLNDLGREEWEIVEFRAQPDNPLAFSGLARRPTQRDWTLEDAAAAAAKAEAEKLRAEFEAKFKAATSGAGAGEERAPSFLEEKLAPDDGFRKPVDTSHDDEPEPEENEKDEWDKLGEQEDELPTFFEAIKPHMRRNQRGPGQSVGVDYLAKKWDQAEEDLKGALVECGFEIPEDEDTKPVYVEYDGDLYWLNVNRRGELWINTKEKPRPMFKAVKAQRIAVEEEAKAEDRGQRSEDRGRRTEGRGRGGPRPESGDQPADAVAGGGEEPSVELQTANSKPEPAGTAQPLPEGPALLEKIRPMMRRNRRGPGGSGSASFLSRALRTNEAELRAAFVRLGLTMPAGANDKPVYTEIGNFVWWLNLDSRGGLWINGREKREGEAIAPATEAPAAPAVGVEPVEGETGPVDAPAASAATESIPALEAAAAASSREQTAPHVSRDAVLAGVRLLLKETKTGSIAGKVDRLAEELGKSAEDFVGTLVAAGLKVPEKAREKPVFVEHAGEIFWLNRNAKGELWLNAKTSKYTDKKADGDAAEGEAEAGAGAGEGEKRPRRRGGRSRKKPESPEAAE